MKIHIMATRGTLKNNILDKCSTAPVKGLTLHGYSH